MSRSILVILTLFAATAARTEAPGSLLRRAIMARDVAGAAAALDKGASLEQRMAMMTPLAFAVRGGQKEMVELLLERGALVDATSMSGPRGPTALSFAARDQRADLVSLLLAKGASTEAAIGGLSRLCAQSDDACRKALRLLGGGDEEMASVPSAAASAVVPAAGTPPLPTAATVLVPNFSGSSRQDDFAVVIGVENYADLPSAQYAERDAVAVRRFVAALGVPERNIATLTGARATKTGLEKTIEAWLPNNVSEKSRVFVFYSGHGAPDPKTGDAYLVPSDGDPQYLAQTGYPLKRLYAKLGELKTKNVIVALDSCFSGAGGRSVLAKGTRPLVGKVDMSAPEQGRVAVISASAGDQISGANDEAGYGLFTYNLLQGLNGAAKDARGQVTLKSLYEYVKPRVADQARRANREQMPQLQCDGEDVVLRGK